MDLKAGFWFLIVQFLIVAYFYFSICVFILYSVYSIVKMMFSHLITCNKYPIRHFIKRFYFHLLRICIFKRDYSDCLRLQFRETI